VGSVAEKGCFADVVTFINGHSHHLVVKLIKLKNEVPKLTKEYLKRAEAEMGKHANYFAVMAVRSSCIVVLVIHCSYKFAHHSLYLFGQVASAIIYANCCNGGHIHCCRRASECINVHATLNNMILISQVQIWHSFIGQKSCDTGHPRSPMNSNPDLPDCIDSLPLKLHRQSGIQTTKGKKKLPMRCGNYITVRCRKRTGNATT